MCVGGFVFVLFCLFRAALTANGGCQAKGQMEATAAGLHQNSQQHWILNPLSKARDQTLVFMVASWVRQPLSHDGNSWNLNVLKVMQGLCGGDFLVGRRGKVWKEEVLRNLK